MNSSATSPRTAVAVAARVPPDPHSRKAKAMKRFHVHVAVSDLEQSIRFYSALFGAEPAVRKPDYAKWMLEDPRINFAISNCCYAKSDKYWTIDPQGVAWESFHTLDSVPMYGSETRSRAPEKAAAGAC